MVIRAKHIIWFAVVIVLLAAGGIGLWLYLRPTDENLIRNQFSRLAALASKNTKEGARPAAARAKEMASLFSGRSTFAVDGLDWMAGPFNHEALSGNIFRSRAMFSKLTLSLDDLEPEIDAPNRKAKVYLSAVLSGTLKDGKSIREVRELECHMLKTDDGWVFDSFKVRQIIRK